MSRVFLAMLISLCHGYLFKCPETAQWSMRAKYLCPDPSKYFCMENILLKMKGFTENCTKVDLERAGRRMVLNGGWDALYCSSNRYQPTVIVFWTNVSTDCIYIRSNCTEVGQVVSNDTDVNYDTTCMCDFSKGYAYVTIPRNPCSCIPSEEDCSCYQQICSENDFKCRGKLKNGSMYNCTTSVLKSDKQNISETLNKKTKHVKDYNTFNITEAVGKTSKYAFTAPLLLVIFYLVVLSIYFVVRCLRNEIRQKTISLELQNQTEKDVEVQINSSTRTIKDFISANATFTEPQFGIPFKMNFVYENTDCTINIKDNTNIRIRINADENRFILKNLTTDREKSYVLKEKSKYSISIKNETNIDIGLHIRWHKREKADVIKAEQTWETAHPGTKFMLCIEYNKKIFMENINYVGNLKIGVSTDGKRLIIYNLTTNETILQETLRYSET